MQSDEQGQIDPNIVLVQIKGLGYVTFLGHPVEPFSLFQYSAILKKHPVYLN